MLTTAETLTDRPLPPEAAAALHPADLATLLQQRSPQDAWAILATLPPETQAEAFGYLPLDRQAAIARIAPRRAFAALLSAMDADERADLWARLDEASREAIAPALAAAEREDIRRLASYPPGTAGAEMTSEYATLRPEMTAREAIEALRAQAAQARRRSTSPMCSRPSGGCLAPSRWRS